MSRKRGRSWKLSGNHLPARYSDDLTIIPVIPALLTMVCVAGGITADNPKLAAPQEWVRVADDRKGFVLSTTRRPFVPRGFNYDHDERGRLLEDYWVAEWGKVAEDFAEMRALGANTVRIHLQFARFIREPGVQDPAALDRLGRLIRLAEENGLYLDLTGLGCYRKEDVPPWYDALSEVERWNQQAGFWTAVARSCSGSPAVFCYDLMNEPVVPGAKRSPGDWLGPPFAGKYHYVQFIALDPGDRPRARIAAEWIRKLKGAIREQDSRRLITVGLVPWSLDRPGLTSGFIPDKVAPELDFLSVHLYPERSKLAEAMDTLRGFAAGKPVLIEETFPLACSVAEFRQFLSESSKVASGLIGFYWGRSLDECRRSGEIADALMAEWLELFRSGIW